MVRVDIIGVDERRMQLVEKRDRQWDPFFLYLQGQIDVSGLQNPLINTNNENKSIDICHIIDFFLRQDQPTSPEEDLIRCIWCLGHLQLASFYQSLDEIDMQVGLSEEDATECGIDLRVALEDFNNNFENFTWFIRRHVHGSAPQSKLDDIQENVDHTKGKVQTLERAIAGAVQSRVSVNSLEASRMSIQESKSVRLSKAATIHYSSNVGAEGKLMMTLAVTILAFVFVPATLAASIFGMNVQQINDTGGNIWHFVVTALCLTSAAFLAWGLSVLIRPKPASQSELF